MQLRSSLKYLWLVLVLGWTALPVKAQILTPGGPVTPPPVASDPGTIISTPSADPTKVRCWISRNIDSALAACIYNDPTYQVPMANIRLYQLAGNGFVAKQITFKETLANGTVQNYDVAVLNVRMEKVEDGLGRLRHYELAYYPSGFNANGTGKEPRVMVGWAKFAAGKSGRASSDAVFRMHRKIQQPAGAAVPMAAPAGTGPANGGDPCDGPPVDDIGEEEDTAAGAPLTPGPALSLRP